MQTKAARCLLLRGKNEQSFFLCLLLLDVSMCVCDSFSDGSKDSTGRNGHKWLISLTLGLCCVCVCVYTRDRKRDEWF